MRGWNLNSVVFFGDSYLIVPCTVLFTGALCEYNIDECDVQCLKGTCMDEVNGFTCSCNNGYTGELCEVMYLYSFTTGTVCVSLS